MPNCAPTCCCMQINYELLSKCQEKRKSFSKICGLIWQNQAAGQHKMDNFRNWQANDITERAFNFIHQKSSGPLYGIGSGLVQRFPAFGVGSQNILWPGCKMDTAAHAAAVLMQFLSILPGQIKGAENIMPSAIQFGQHLCGA